MLLSISLKVSIRILLCLRSFNSAWMDEFESIRKVLGALLSRGICFARRPSWVRLPVTLECVWLLEVWLPVLEIAFSKLATMHLPVAESETIRFASMLLAP